MHRTIASTDYRIITQGGPIVNSISVYKKYDDIILLEIDLKSKYCEVVGGSSSNEGTVSIFIGATEESLYLDEEHKDKFPWTHIEFLGTKGWSVWASNGGRYSIQVCLVNYLAKGEKE